jgi:hypothetical protein
MPVDLHQSDAARGSLASASATAASCCRVTVTSLSSDSFTSESVLRLNPLARTVVARKLHLAMRSNRFGSELFNRLSMTVLSGMDDAFAAKLLPSFGSLVAASPGFDEPVVESLAPQPARTMAATAGMSDEHFIGGPFL